MGVRADKVKLEPIGVILFLVCVCLVPFAIIFEIIYSLYKGNCIASDILLLIALLLASIALFMLYYKSQKDK